jgi:hypothetical protein
MRIALAVGQSMPIPVTIGLYSVVHDKEDDGTTIMSFFSFKSDFYAHNPTITILATHE